MNLNFCDPSLFTRVYFDFQEAKTRFVIVYGGASSSKSYSVHQHELINVLDNPKKDTLFLRKYGTDIRESCFKLLKEIAIDWGIYDMFQWKYSNDVREVVSEKRKILFKGMDDPAKLKSIVGIQRIIMEEAEQFTKEDFLELNRRARGVKDIQIVLVFNPILETHWIKEHFFDTPEIKEQCTFIHATYKDNQDNLTKEDIDQLELLSKYAPNDYRVYALGQWGKPNVELPFVSNFNRNKHVGKTEYNPKFPLHFSMDFNIDPFVCLVSQKYFDHNGHHVHYLREIVLKNKDVMDMCNKIASLYDRVQLSTALFTGDATGSKRSVLKKNIDAWRQIDQFFVLRKRLVVPRSNPRVSDNRQLIDAIFGMHNDLKIDPEMTLTINELQFTEADTDGNILKKDRNKLEQRADALDCVRYDLTTHMRDFAKNPRKYVRNL